jgi:8-amino-7-oxononanoate synthase
MTRRTFDTSLAEYAVRRFARNGAGLIKEHDPFFVPHDSLQADHRDFVSFALYDYLDVAQHPAVIAAATAALETFGTGVAASRVVGGQRMVHDQLETSLARFMGVDAVLAMVSGYGTNVSLVSYLLGNRDLIIHDSLAHNSILVGMEASRAKSVAFAHNDMADLERVLQTERGQHRRALVIVEGLYSMDGDIADLPRILELCRRYDAWLMVDEAHSIGVLGKTGRGLTEHYGIDPKDVDLIVGTLSKTFGHCGGFICGHPEVIRWLRYTMPGFVYSVGLAPVLAAGVTAAIDLVRREPERVERMRSVSRYFVATARRFNFDVGDALGAGVAPVIFETMAETMSASAFLLQRGIHVPPIVQIGVPKDRPRLRFFITARHTTADVDRAFEVLCEWRAMQDTVGGVGALVTAPTPAAVTSRSA